MAGSLKHVLGAASLLTLLAGASVASAQSGRPWVDPPADTGPAAKAPPTTPSSTTPPSDTSQDKRIAPAGTPEPRTENARASQPAPTQEQSVATGAQSPSNIADEGKARKPPARSVATASSKTPPARKTAAADRAKVLPETRTREAERIARDRSRSAKVRDGVNSGLEVMSLQTIEFPDGRRVDVLVRPNSRTLSRLMDEAY